VLQPDKTLASPSPCTDLSRRGSKISKGNFDLAWQIKKIEGKTRSAIAIGFFALVAPLAATAAELTADLRAKLDRLIDEKTQQVCTDQQNAGSGIEADACFQTMKPLIKRDLEEAFQTFQQWQHEQQQSGGEQGRSGGGMTSSGGATIRHCGSHGCQ
jgi:hypothetical protein